MTVGMADDTQFLQKVLRWASEQAGVEPQNVPDSVSELTQAQKEHFFNAVDQAKGVDVPKRMGAIGAQLEQLRVCSSADEPEREDTLLQLLDELLEHVEKIDHANDLHTVGALVPVLQLAQSDPIASVRALALQLLSTVAQNNPTGQETLLQQSAHSLCLQCASNSDESDDVRAQAFTALASIARGHTHATSVVLSDGGVDAAVQALGDPSCSVRVHRKALQLLRYYAERSEDALSKLVEGNAPEHAAPLMRADDTIAREQSAGLLTDIARHVDFSKHPSAVEQLRSSTVVDTVNERKHQLHALSGEDAEAAHAERANLDQLSSMLMRGGQG